jgi:hypothetical protein
VISAHRLAKPQWTPFEEAAPEWMKLDFQLFLNLEGQIAVHEVFPTSSYTLLHGNTGVRVGIDFFACKPGPKDMLDSWVTAVTVREFVEGRRTEVGGGDGLGTIILPRPLPEPVQNRQKDRPFDVEFELVSALTTLFPERIIKAVSENLERERTRLSISPFCWSSSSRPSVATTR